MKKLFLGLAVAASSIAFGQQFGAKAGVNVSSLTSTNELDSKSKTGFYAGIFMNAPLASNFSIQPELLYENSGAKASTFSNVDVKQNLDYIAIPVMFQYNATPELYFEAGPKFSFLVNNKFTSDNATVENLLNQAVNKDSYSTFDFGLGLGAGYYFTPNIGINVRYMAGLTDIYKDNKGDAVKNSAFQAGLSFKF